MLTIKERFTMHAFFLPRVKTTPVANPVAAILEAATPTVQGKKRVIQDDDDDDDNHFPIENENTTNVKTLAIETPSSITASATPIDKVLKTTESTVTNTLSVISDDDIPSDLRDIITWKMGDRIPYSAICNTFEKISQVSGRLEKEMLFCKLFRAGNHPP